MSTRQLYTLGTASQVPTTKRNHNAFFLRWDAEGILFDPGEGTQRQMAMAGLAATDITRICITHFHGDHCLGLAGVVQRLSLDGVAHEVPVHYPASGQVFFDRLRRASIFLSRERLVPMPIRDAGIAFDGPDATLEVHPLSHEVDCYGYRWAEKPAWRADKEALARHGVRGPAVGVVLRDGVTMVDGRAVRREDVAHLRPGQAFAFVMDTRPCDAAVELARRADLLVAESTFLDAEREVADRAGHMTARQAGALARRAGARRLVLCHFSQRYPDTAPFLDEARREHDDVVIAVEPTAERPDCAVPVPPRLTSMS